MFARHFQGLKVHLQSLRDASAAAASEESSSPVLPSLDGAAAVTPQPQAPSIPSFFEVPRVVDLHDPAYFSRTPLWSLLVATPSTAVYPKVHSPAAVLVADGDPAMGSDPVHSPAAVLDGNTFGRGVHSSAAVLVFDGDPTGSSVLLPASSATRTTAPPSLRMLGAATDPVTEPAAAMGTSLCSACINNRALRSCSFLGRFPHVHGWVQEYRGRGVCIGAKRR